MGLRNGRLREVARIDEKVVTNHPETNEEVVTWQKHCDAFVSTENLRAREFIENGQIFARNLVKFSGNFFDLMTVRESMRLRHDGNVYDIVAVRADHQRKKDIEIDGQLVT